MIRKSEYEIQKDLANLETDLSTLEITVATKTEVNDTASDSADTTYSASKIEERIGTEVLITADYVLPSVSAYSGKRLIIKNVDSVSHNVTGGTIDGETSQTLYSYDCMQLYSNGLVWYII